MKNIIFIAPPSSGKGTQSELLKDKYGYEHISTGDILRSEASKNTKEANELKEILKSGHLVSDELIIEILNKKILSLMEKPFILDGFPRTLNQAEELNKIFNNINMDNYIVIHLELDKNLAMQRALGRLVCSCGKSYNIYDEKLKPKNQNKCDSCGKTLLKRSDDTEEHFLDRFESYLKETKPVLDFYESMSKVKHVDASINKEVTYKQIEENI